MRRTRLRQRGGVSTGGSGGGGGPTMKVGMNMGVQTYFTPNLPFANLLWGTTLWRRTDDASDAIWSNQPHGMITGATGTMTFYATLFSNNSDVPTQTFRFKNPDGNQIGFGTSSGSQDIVSYATGAAATSSYINVPYTSGTNLYIHCKGNITNTAGTILGAPHLLLPGHESSFASGDYFNSAAASFHTGLGTRVVRVMDWVGTNVTAETDWADRSVTGKLSFRAASGTIVPWEICVAWANKINADLWVNVPPRATSAYVTSLMTLLAANLTSTLNVYIERGNELWNTDGAFQSNTNWVEYRDHTRISLAISGSTITKTAHGYADGTPFKTWETTQALALGIDSDNAFALYPTYYKLARGSTLYTKSTGANTFQLWTGAGGTGTLCEAPPLVTSLVGIVENEAGKTADLNAHVGELSVLDWAAADTAFGGTSRVKAVMPTLAINSSLTTARLSVTGAASRCNHVAPAPYHDGYVWGGQVDRTTTTFTPKFWCNGSGTFHYSVYSSGSTPRLDQRKAGTGTGFLYHKSLAYTTVDGAYTTDTTATGFTNGVSYEHWIDFVDADGATWSVKKTIAAGSAFTTDFLDTDANQNLRNTWDLDRTDTSGVIYQIQSHKTAAQALNANITVVHYEGGSHQSFNPPTAIKNAFETYRESTSYATFLTHYYYNMAAAGTVLHMHYSDMSSNSSSPSPFRIANSYTDTTDKRYLAIAAFAGEVPIRTLVDSSTVTGNNFDTAPSYPATVATFADATWTYALATKGDVDAGNYSITGNVLSMTSAGAINFSAPASQSVWIYATDGYTDAYFPVSFTTGSAWYSSSAKFAWSTIEDTTPATLNPTIGSALTTSSAATSVSDGWDLVGSATYTGGHGNGTVAYTDNPLFLMVARIDDETNGYRSMLKFGSSPYVNWMTGGSTSLFLDTTAFGTISVPIDNTLAVHWIWFDNANLKYYWGKNQTTGNSGGTTYSSQGSATISDFVAVGGSCTAVISGGESCTAANITEVLATVQKLQTKHSIA